MKGSWQSHHSGACSICYNNYNNRLLAFSFACWLRCTPKLIYSLFHKLKGKQTACQSGITVTNNNIVLVFLSVTTTNNTGHNVSLWIHFVYNGNMEAHRNRVRLPASLYPHCQSSFSREISCPVADKIAWGKQGLYGTNLILCNQHLLHNDTLMQKNDSVASRICEV